MKKHARRNRGVGVQQAPSNAILIKRWTNLEWRRRWEDTIHGLPRRRQAVAWRTPWEQEPRKLYAGLAKAEATALFLMRTEVIGLNAWLAAIQVPGIHPTCPCGWHAQTVRHILLHCPKYDRRDLLIRCRTERFEDLLTTTACAPHAARWLTRIGALQQFQTAAEIATEDTSGYEAFVDADRW
jgi:hypothetical protein